MGNQQSFFNQWIAGIGNDVEEGLDNLFWSGPEIKSCIDMDAEWLLCRNGPLGSESRDCTQLTHLGIKGGAAKDIAVAMGKPTQTWRNILEAVDHISAGSS